MLKNFNLYTHVKNNFIIQYKTRAYGLGHLIKSVNNEPNLLISTKSWLKE